MILSSDNTQIDIQKEDATSLEHLTTLHQTLILRILRTQPFTLLEKDMPVKKSKKVTVEGAKYIECPSTVINNVMASLDLQYE